jgi:thiamine-phosphate pyrophosphorylase
VYFVCFVVLNAPREIGDDMTDFGFYLVMTNPAVGYARCAEAAVKAGVRIIQLRMKHAERADILREAREVRRITRGTDTLFIVNDDPSIAAEAEADGVHVGQDDMSVAEVRRRFPSLKTVGLSTHNLAQARAAAETAAPHAGGPRSCAAATPDYIGVGPVYATPTKDIPDPTLGPEMAGRMIAAARVPAVAIGGINVETLPPVLAAGARNFAVVRAVCQSTDPYSAIRKLLDTHA